MQLNVSANEHFQQEICSNELIRTNVFSVNISANEHFQQKFCSNELMFFSINISAIACYSANEHLKN